jgi:DNA-binding HxlR family transcriptional regulator
VDEVLSQDCPAREVIDHVTGKWGVLILLALRRGDLRFYELRNAVEGVTDKVLSQSLRVLVRDGLVWRAVEPVNPPRVTYGLSALGTELGTHLGGLTDWIRDNAGALIAAQEAFDVSAPRATAPTAGSR